MHNSLCSFVSHKKHIKPDMSINKLDFFLNLKWTKEGEATPPEAAKKGEKNKTKLTHVSLCFSTEQWK